MENLIVKQKFTGKNLAEIKMHNCFEVEEMLVTAVNLSNKEPISKQKRLEILQKLQNLIALEQEEFAKLIANEGGKPIIDARVEVTRGIDGINIAIAELKNLKGQEIAMELNPASASREAWTVLEPIGVVVAISAFNHPLNLIIHQVVPAIATGCPVIVKPSDATPLCCLRFLELALKAGLPIGWLQVAITNRENSEKLATDSRIGFLSFIGSAKVGWYLKSKLANGVRCSLEHGGVAPLIFDKYKDEDGFISGAVKASMYHSGQVCVSVQRIYLPHNKALEIANKIAKLASKQIVGDAINENSDLGPLINSKEVLRIESWVNQAITEGATLLTGGKILNSVSYAPTVLFNPNAKSKVSTQEIFGPVVCIYSYENIDEAIKNANSLNVAFQAAVFSDNIDFALNIAKRLDASAVMINDYTTFRVDWMPFAGRKHSGYGTGGIGYTMKDMLEQKMFVVKA